MRIATAISISTLAQDLLGYTCSGITMCRFMLQPSQPSTCRRANYVDIPGSDAAAFTAFDSALLNCSRSCRMRCLPQTLYASSRLSVIVQCVGRPWADVINHSFAALRLARCRRLACPLRLNRYTPLHYAAEQNLPDAVTLLLRLRKSAKAETELTTGGNTALHLAAAAGSPDAARVLLQRLSIEQRRSVERFRNHNGQTPLELLVATASAAGSLPANSSSGAPLAVTALALLRDGGAEDIGVSGLRGLAAAAGEHAPVRETLLSAAMDLERELAERALAQEQAYWRNWAHAAEKAEEREEEVNAEEEAEEEEEEESGGEEQDDEPEEKEVKSRYLQPRAPHAASAAAPARAQGERTASLPAKSQGPFQRRGSAWGATAGPNAKRVPAEAATAAGAPQRQQSMPATSEAAAAAKPERKLARAATSASSDGRTGVPFSPGSAATASLLALSGSVHDLDSEAAAASSAVEQAFRRGAPAAHQPASRKPPPPRRTGSGGLRDNLIGKAQRAGTRPAVAAQLSNVYDILF